MKDGEHEGVSGARIDEVNKNLDASSKSKPNLYLINAGTNDCQQNYKKMQGTIERMEELLMKAWKLSGRATIVLSTLTPSFNGADKNARVDQLNVEVCDDAVIGRRDKADLGVWGCRLEIVSRDLDLVDERGGSLA